MIDAFRITTAAATQTFHWKIGSWQDSNFEAKSSKNADIGIKLENEHKIGFENLDFGKPFCCSN